MDSKDIQYRNLLHIKKQTMNDKDITSMIEQIQKSDTDKDKIEVLKKVVIIEEDWIKEIEDGIIFIERAINEERQFIRSNGEVVPIEKAKHVSSESVRHLAQHSNLITRLPDEGEDLTPDSIYTIERMSDYAVYENRFLYLVLKTLNSFIIKRLEKILEFSNSYNGSLNIDKSVHMINRTLDIKISMNDNKKDDEYLKQHNESQDVISRIQTLHRCVTVFLSTPLMEIVSKAALIKPPITKTNVLKMNVNFKRILALYDYIVSYNKDGYRIEEKSIKISPFNKEISNNFSNLISLLSFTTYLHGNSLEKYIKERYIEEEEKIKEAELQKRVEQIKKLKKRLEQNQINSEEYILELEKTIREFEKEHEDYIACKKENEELTNKLSVSMRENEILHEEFQNTVQEYETKIACLIEEHKAEVEKITSEYEKKIEDITNGYEKRISDLLSQIEAIKESFTNEINKLKSDHEIEIVNLKESYDNAISKLNEEIVSLKAKYEEELLNKDKEYQSLIDGIKEEHSKKLEEQKNGYQIEISSQKENYEKIIETLNKDISSKSSDIEILSKEKDKLKDLNSVLEGKINAIKYENHIIGPDEKFTSRESFTELEKEFKAFKKFYREQWKLTKKEIVKNVKSEQKGGK